MFMHTDLWVPEGEGFLAMRTRGCAVVLVPFDPLSTLPPSSLLAPCSIAMMHTSTNYEIRSERDVVETFRFRQYIEH